MSCVDATLLDAAPERIADWRALPLHAGGRSLIEASAGTGKTWTISVLYLRLLLEGDAPLGPRQIAVTTFTEAAAQELHERLRQRIAWAERHAMQAVAGQCALDASSSDDAWLLSRWDHGDGGPAQRARIDLNRLRLAQVELDMAPIGTLHGFCRRVLADYPFECGSAFAPGEMADGRAITTELLQDLWRELVQSDGQLDPGAQAWLVAGREALFHAMERVLAPGVDIRELDAHLFEEIMHPLQAQRLREFLEDRSKFARSNAGIIGALEELAALIDGGDPAVGLRKDGRKYFFDDIHKQFKPAFVDEACSHPTIRFAQRAVRALVHAGAPEKAQALRRFRDRILVQRERRLRERGLLTFDAQITRVHAALHGDSGDGLAARLHQAYPVMLVDEFQDTDAQQFAILDRLYRDTDGLPRGRLVMIGDPKQAIYRFRGGDIQAYLDARAGADTVLHLTTNFRASSALVSALNEWHAAAGDALSQHDNAIRVEPVTAGGHADATPLIEHGHPCARPLVFHFNDDVPANVEARCEAALAACANHIAGLLQARSHHIGDDTLRPGDIAVLLPQHKYVARLRELLSERDVPCVGAGRDSVFSTPLARELLVFLHGVEHAGYEPAVRAALATRLGGATFDMLRELHDDAPRWQMLAQRFARLRARWHSAGVLAVVRELMAENGALLLRGGDGERLLTDLRHLAELLQEAAERLDGPQALLAWFANQREASAAEAAEEQQLRIESDARRVRLMTLHASKGLEFPVVFLPLMWTHEGRKVDLPLVHENGMRVLDLGSEAFDDAVREDMGQDQDERFRVLYVAMTRAQHACHVYVLPTDRPANGNTKAPSADPQRSALDAMVERALLRHGDGPTLHTACRHLAWSTGWPWEVVRYRADETSAMPSPTVLPEPPLPRHQGKHSFSTLVRAVRINIAEESSAVDEDIVEPQVEPIVEGDVGVDAEHPQLLELSPVRGPDFGNALHAIFEHRRIGASLDDQHEFVRRCLLDSGVRSRELPVDALTPLVAGRIQAALEAELLPALRLGTIPAQRMRAEMEFHFALDEVSIRELRAACAAHGEPALVPSIALSRINGLMTGKIDLVFQHDGRFHVLDYKGNWLGGRVSDYLPATLRDAMDHHHYRFQALLYTVAVDRYLRHRLPRYERSRQLGEAIYLFVRAAGLAPGAGVWTQRFDDGLIEAVDRVLARGQGA